MLEEKYYDFKIESLKRLMDMTISMSFSKYPNIYFQIHEMKNHKTMFYWREGLPDRKFIDVAVEANKIVSPEICLTLNDIIQYPEYFELMGQKSPIYSEILDDETVKLLYQILNYDIDENIKIPGGRDGHNYYIKIYTPMLKKICCWCILPEKWKLLAQFINTIVNTAKLDKMYYAKIY